jgi:hypothetical protein
MAILRRCELFSDIDTMSLYFCTTFAPVLLASSPLGDLMARYLNALGMDSNDMSHESLCFGWRDAEHVARDVSNHKSAFISIICLYQLKRRTDL